MHVQGVPLHRGATSGVLGHAISTEAPGIADRLRGGVATAETLQQRRERYDAIIAARDSGKTFAEIGEMFDPPLTRQRVHTIVRSGPPRANGRPPRRKEEG